LRIWFDDCLIAVYTKAFPLMKKYNQIGILPVITSCVGDKMYWSAVGTEEPESWEDCMSTDQLLELIKAGWKVASHSVTHRNLDEIPTNEAEREILESKKWIIENLKVSPIAFVPPNHRITPELKQFAELFYGFVRNGSDPIFHFASFNVSNDLQSLERLLIQLQRRKIQCE